MKKKTIAIDETPQEFQEIEKEVDGLSFRELYDYMRRMRKAGAEIKSYEVKFHSRFSMSFIPLVMCFLAIPFSAHMKRSGGMSQDLFICLMLTLSYWLFYSVGLSLGSKGTLVPWFAAWCPSLIFLSIALLLVVRKA